MFVLRNQHLQLMTQKCNTNYQIGQYSCVVIVVIVVIINRRQVYRILEENDIDVPKYYVLDRNSGDEVIEMDDTIEINGQSLSKPFVEKPVSAEDHSVYVYFPSDYGGGSQRLFRKVLNRFVFYKQCIYYYEQVRDRSSNYSKESTVRKSGSFLYEEFLATDGTTFKTP